MKNNKSNAIEKALDILMAFLPKNPELGTTDITRKTGFNVATVSRTIQLLTRKGFLWQNPQNRKYKLGPSIFSLGQASLESVTECVVRVAMPFLIELSEKVGETVVLEMLSGHASVIAYVAQGSRAVSIRGSIGARVPTHAAAGSKAIIAFSSPEIRDVFLNKNLRAYTHKTITDPSQLKHHLDKIRKQGVAFCREEIDIGINAIGVPILNHGNKPVAGLVVVGPSPRIKCNLKSPIVADLRASASTIASQLFHPESVEKMNNQIQIG
jgi:IclR family KDG regulon transcriptional repressor